MADGIGYNDMMRMQSEAVQRVQEMQRRARNAVQRANAQRTGRAQEQPQSKGEISKAPPIQHSAKSTALPLDYISAQPPEPAKKPLPPPAISEEAHGQSAEKKQDGSNTSALLSGNPDRLLVIALILLLSQEEADELLLMALGYLIM